MMGGDTMLRALKSYWAFTNGIYKLVMLGIVPLALIVGFVLSASEGAGNSLFFMFALFVVDIGSDFFFMNGAYCKEQEFSNYIQSSSKYIALIKEVAGVDILRRVLMYQIPFVMELIFAVGDAGRMQWCKLNSFWPWLEILVAQCIVLATRHFIVWHKVYGAMVIGWIVMMILFVFFATVLEGSAVVNSVLIALIFVVSVVTIWYTEKKGKERYYD